MRCINLDWLEVHCLEPQEPRDANFFRTLGWHCVERPYGTRVYKEMFTIYFPDGEPFLEIRRAPAAYTSTEAAKFFEPYSCHIRLHNRTCYLKTTNPENPADNCTAATLLAQFIEQYGFTFRRISRVDICLDFERFDSGDNPQKFLYRYLKGKFSKINQCNLSAHGKDMWDGRAWNSISWGSRNSQIGTKMYNKSMEISEGRDKPYIRQAWASAGLVEDMTTLLKHKKDGSTYKPEIWRVEFSIQSSVKKWFVIEHDNLGNKCKRSKHNRLEDYATDSQLLTVFASLADHYFHFKYFEGGKRKDRCLDKQLFKFGSLEAYYKVEKVATSKPPSSALLALKSRLEGYRMTHYDKDTNNAVSVLLQAIASEIKRDTKTMPYTDNELILFRRLISYRIKGTTRPISDDIKFIQDLLSLEEKIF